MNMLDLSIIVVNFNTRELTLRCIDSVVKNTKRGRSQFAIKYELIVVDNSTLKNEKVKIGREEKNIKVIEMDENRGFGAANNRGIEVAKGKYILFLNSDTTIHDNVLGEMISWIEKNKEVGVASCALANRDGSLQGTGGYFPTLARVFSWMTIQDLPLVDRIIKPFHPMKEKTGAKNIAFYTKYRELDWVTGAFMLVRKKILDKVGGFDEDYFMYTEETDLCFRIKELGYKVVYNPSWSITHLGGASGTREMAVLSEFKSVKLFYKKHYGMWKYVILRILLKAGALWRIPVLGILEGGGVAKTYAKAFSQA